MGISCAANACWGRSFASAEERLRSGRRHNSIDVEYYVEYTPHMVVQIVIDKKLLQAADQAARRARSNRSAVVRDALRQHLRRLEIRDKEERDRQGYSRKPQSREETVAWEAEAAWPPA